MASCPGSETCETAAVQAAEAHGLHGCHFAQGPALQTIKNSARIGVSYVLSPHTSLYRLAAIVIRAAAWDLGVAHVPVAKTDGGYKPSEDEIFMNERQKDYFRRKLMAWKEEILRESQETLIALQRENENHSDLADRASSETDRSVELRARDRQRKLIAKIDSALERLDAGTYGYCEETGEPISLKRLDARPIATLSIEAQERHERRERIHRED